MSTKDYVVWKATFTMPLDEASNPLYQVCRMPNLVRTEQEASIHTLSVHLDREHETVTFQPYLKVVPEAIHLVHADLQRIPGYDGFVQIQQNPGEPFDQPTNPTILSFANFEPSWLRPFNVFGKVSDLVGLNKDITGFFWKFNLFDSQGNSVHCWFYTDNEEGFEEGAQLPNLDEGDLALCVNVTPNLEDGIRIGRRSEFFIFKD